MSVGISSLSDGQHNWSVSCSDEAGNLKASEGRSFIVNTVPAAPQFGLAITRNSFNTGEGGQVIVAAPNGSSVRVEVCPDTTGFVECNVSLNQQGGQYPAQASLPFLNYAGRYVVEAHFTSGNYSETKTERYNVTSTISVSATAPDEVRKNDLVELVASASGGLGDLNLTWKLSNGTSIEYRKANITYSAPGNYTNFIIVKDDYNNTVQKNLTTEVTDAFAVTIIAKDNESGEAVPEATARLDGESDDTNTLGETELHVRGGVRSLVILAENYTIYQAELNITGDLTYTALLDRIDKEVKKPIVTLTYPDNDFQTLENSTIVTFHVSHNLDANCSLYLAEDNSAGFYTYLASAKVSAGDSSDKTFEIYDLENKAYYWKIECVDSQKVSGVSETRKITVGLSPQIEGGQASQQIAEINSMVKDLENVSQQFSNMPKDLHDIITAMGLDSDIDSRIKTMKNSIRDLDSLNFKGLSAEQASSELQRLVSQAKDAYNKAPVGFSLVSSDSFVDYIDKSGLEDLAREYAPLQYGENYSINIKRAVKWLDDLQQEAVISSKVGTIGVSYKDGSSKQYTAVIRDVKTYNISRGTVIVESIPKDVVPSAKDILSPLDFSTLKDDPLISFPVSKDTTLVYYFEGSVGSEALRGIKTAVFGDLTKIDPEYVTGFSINSLGFGNGGKMLIPLLTLIVLAGLIVGGIRYEGTKAVQYAAYLIRKKDTLHYMNVVLNDINDNMQMGNLDKAIGLYQEAKIVYAELPTMAKNDVYDSISSVAAKIQEYQGQVEENSQMSRLNELIISAERGLGEQDVYGAIQSYKQIEALYHELEDSDKELIHPHLIDLGTKIQVLIASNTRQSQE